MTLQQIPKSALVPSDCKRNVVGRGSFVGIVKQMVYRGIDVAVKTFDSDHQFYVRPVVEPPKLATIFYVQHN